MSRVKVLTPCDMACQTSAQLSGGHLTQPTIVVSSSVYGQEALLDQIFAVLRGYGYGVWMSHKGTIPLDPKLTAFENCLAAVEKCDAMFGIITGRYGSGKIEDELSITHREMLKAIELEKPRFFAVQRDVILARQLLRQFRNDEHGKPRPHTFFRATPALDDIRVIDLYDAATRASLELQERKGNWVQQFDDASSLLLFVETQFSDIERFKKIIEKNSDNRR